MSRIGKMPISLPQGVKVALAVGQVKIDGPKGSLSQLLPAGITCDLAGDVLTVSRRDESKEQKSLHGLVRSLLANAVHGTSVGFAKGLHIEGIGYRAEVKGKDLNLALGYSHPVVYHVPDDVQIKVEKQTEIAITGVDKQQVGQVAAEIRALRPPEPYKGKGIRYSDERVRRKVGKAGA
ncbi:MAG: 50S ribosomal protein L6 [Acidobacteriota bacterium]